MREFLKIGFIIFIFFTVVLIITPPMHMKPKEKEERTSPITEMRNRQMGQEMYSQDYQEHSHSEDILLPVFPDTSPYGRDHKKTKN